MDTATRLGACSRSKGHRKVVALDGAGLGQRLANADISERKRIDEFKSEFIAVVNHDLPTPSPR
jgi:signal transduction histidine kinase